MFSTREEGEVAQDGGSRTYPHQLPTKAFRNLYSPCETSHFRFTLVIQEVSESKEDVCANGWENQEVAKLTCRSLSVAGSSQQT